MKEGYWPLISVLCRKIRLDEGGGPFEWECLSRETETEAMQEDCRVILERELDWLVRDWDRYREARPGQPLDESGLFLWLMQDDPWDHLHVGDSYICGGRHIEVDDEGSFWDVHKDEQQPTADV